jgi:hypothetical protein
MSDALKVLAQSQPAANTLTTIYTVPNTVDIGTTVSSIVICNTAATSDVFRISIAIGGAADTPAQYIYYDLPMDGNDTFIATIGISLAEGDEIRVRSTTGNLSFNVFGVEVT